MGDKLKYFIYSSGFCIVFNALLIGLIHYFDPLPHPIGAFILATTISSLINLGFASNK